MPAKTNNDKLAEVLSDGAWHFKEELIKLVSHRYGDNVYLLRLGRYDGRFWNIISETLPDQKKVWRYRWDGFNKSSTPDSPRCLDCGSSHISKHDVRKE